MKPIPLVPVSSWITKAMYFAICALAGWCCWLPFFGAPWQAGLLYAIGFALLCLLPGLAERIPSGRLGKALGMLGEYWIGALLLLAMVALPMGLLLLVAVRWLKALSFPAYRWIAGVVYSIAWIAIAYGSWKGRRISLTRHVISTGKGLRKRLRIVQLSDLHLGNANDASLLARVVEIANRQEPDLVLITGDTFTERIENPYEMDTMAALLRSLTAPLGIYACLGNHDAGPELPKMRKFFADAGIRLLEDEAIPLGEDLLLVGRTDRAPFGKTNAQRPPIGDLLRGQDAARCILMMDHQPAECAEASAAGVDLLLSGHTHGGQFIPVNLLVKREFPHYKGLRYFGPMASVVSSGSGAAVPPIRIGSTSEVIRIDVTGASASSSPHMSLTISHRQRPVRYSRPTPKRSSPAADWLLPRRQASST